MGETDRLTALNEADKPAFVATLRDIVEHSPWVAEAVFDARPFASVDALADAMMRCIRETSPPLLKTLFRLHPELGGAEAGAGAMTASSTNEQGRLGLTSLGAGEFAALAELNRRYRDKFGFPCIIALRLHQDRQTMLRAFERRLTHDPDTEMTETLEQIGQIVLGRLRRLLNAPAGWISTHVLDTATGRPAAGMALRFFVACDTGWRELLAAVTDAEGRTATPLLNGAAMATGRYRIDFHAGDYFRAQGIGPGEPAFLDRVPVEFGISDVDAHYHVPLLCSPWGYTTYRGS